jgi:putative membrane protein
MKTLLITTSLLLLFACNSGENKDSVETAEEANEQREDTMPTAAQPANEDQEFLVEAASGGLMEVKLGQLAAQNASDPAVKDFAQKMVNDHGQANEELKALAARKNITIPSTPGEKHQKHINEMNDKKGKEFDKEYMDLMVDDHKEDVTKFEKAANDCKDPDIKAFAAKHVPALKQHLQTAEALRDKVKG